MATDTSVKFFTSADQGAPQITNVAGSLIAVLDACLVNGYNLMAIQSLTVNSGVATLNFASAHGFTAGRVIMVSGATPAALNGEQRVVSVTTTSLTLATAVADGSATGSMTAKYAGAGWVKVYSGTNKAAYKSGDPQASGMYLRVDDTGTSTARVLGYETMTDVDTGSGPFPTPAQIAGGLYWYKSSTATASAWAVVADARTLYYSNGPSRTASAYANLRVINAFGDIIPSRSGDSYACVMQGNLDGGGSWNLGASASTLSQTNTYNAPSSAMTLPRASTYLGSAVTAVLLSPGSTGTANAGAVGSPYPDPCCNGLILTTAQVYSGGYRGRLPGVYLSPQSIYAALSDLDLMTGLDALPGRQIRAMRSDGNASSIGWVFADVTGPWR